MIIIVDTREKDEYTFCEITSLRSKLDAGDYSVAGLSSAAAGGLAAVRLAELDLGAGGSPHERWSRRQQPPGAAAKPMEERNTAGNRRLEQLLSRKDVHPRAQAAALGTRAQAYLAQNDAVRGIAIVDQLLREHGASADPDIADEVAKARWTKAFHHGQKREIAAALAQLDSLIENYRGRNRHDYSLHASPLEWAEFQRAICLKAMNRSGEAVNALNSLMLKYPESF